jgi:hypothetical protein
LAPQSWQINRVLSRRTSSGSGTTTSITMSGSRSVMISSSAVACATVRGKPSRMNPFRASERSSRSRTIPIITSSLTSSPRSMIALARMPMSVPSWTAARSISPVEIFGIPRLRASRSA